MMVKAHHCLALSSDELILCPFSEKARRPLSSEIIPLRPLGLLLITSSSPSLSRNAFLISLCSLWSLHSMASGISDTTEFYCGNGWYQRWASTEPKEVTVCTVSRSSGLAVRLRVVKSARGMSPCLTNQSGRAGSRPASGTGQEIQNGSPPFCSTVHAHCS